MVSSTEIGQLTAAALAEVETRNAEQVDQAAQLVLGCVRADALVFTAGAGHSLAAVAETFYRAGGLACVYPLYHPELLPLHGARNSTKAERQAGLAAKVLAERAPGPDDVLVVFSTSGVNPYPVELAATARAAGAPVIAVSSRASVAAAPRRAASTLIEEASVVLDNGVRPGDASFPPESPRTAPLSTVLNAFLWNLVLGSVLRQAEPAGLAVPLWQSSNVVGGDEANAALFDRYLPRVPALG
ncbi:sugar isomerase domain-containing protein [Amycolatopsis nigrescens]|uniref:sugar isomerase domain-containing protein n=1 Tax=Amycolatopsis nigrescens TaxID=381445 RepID=UPI000477F3BE|nr:sugar isomerase domain-containing protein [Amycolatopsis nigrescens]